MKRVLMAAALVAAGLLFPARDAAAQYGSARGKVTDDKGQALQDALVTFEYLKGVGGKADLKETKTDKKGNYTQVGLTIGNHKVTVKKEGYVTAAAEWHINSGEPTVIDFKLPVQAAKGPSGDDLRKELVDQFSKADALQKAGKSEDAEAIYKQLLTKPEFQKVGPIYFRLGVIYSDRKDWANAEIQLKKAYEVQPELVDSQLELAEVYAQTDRKAEGEALLAKLAAENATNGPMLYRIGIHYYNEGQPEKAEAIFKTVTTADPSLVDAWFLLGQLALQQAHNDESVADLEKYLSLNPTNAGFVDSAKKLLAALKATAAQTAPKK
jgi:tetratricopeptide (TPR) repeat protein